MYKLTEKQKEAYKILTHKDSTEAMLVGGSRSGKTLLLFRGIVMRAVKAYRSNHAILRRFAIDSHQKLGMQTFPDVMAKCYPELPFELDKANWVITLPNKSRIWIAGLDDDKRVEKILGSEYSTIFIDEISQVSKESVDVAKTRLAEKNKLVKRLWCACNPGLKTHWTYDYFIKNPKPGVVHYRLNPADNLENLDADFLKRLEQLPDRDRQRFLYGEFQDAVEGALWKYTWIAENRKKRPETIADRIIIAVDPAITSGPNSDETGLITIGKYSDSMYIIRDDTIRTTPADWASKVAMIVEKEQADTVVIEGNQGGEVWEALLKNAGVTVKIETISATKSKLARAEPVAALYERQKVHHIQEFTELEDELLSYDGTGDSPNRLDALTLGLSYLDTSVGFITPGIW